MIGNADPERPPSSPAPSPEDARRKELLTALAHPVRRRVLSHLDPSDGPTTLSALADRIADDESRERLVIELHHNHLPKLADCGLIAYDHRDRLVFAE